MGSWRFVLSRRWFFFAVAVAVGAYAFWWLGGWQFGRLHSTKANNEIISTNEHRAPTPIDQVLPDAAPVGHDQQWRAVSAVGSYDPSQTIIVRYQSHDGAPGVAVVVPLVTADGTAVLVDRGFYPTSNSTGSDVTVPPPPTGTVSVVGYLRQDGTGSSTAVDDHSTRAISSAAIGPVIGMRVYGGFVALKSENGKGAHDLTPVDLPDLSNGPHFFYGLQWWFFAVLAVFGFFYLMYDEKVNGRRGTRPGDVPAEVRPAKVRQSNHPYVRARQEAAARAAADQSARVSPPSTGSIEPVTNDAADESRKAAARPNSSGSP